MASEFRVMNKNGTFTVQEDKGDGEWEEIAFTNDIHSAKELVRNYRKLK